MTNDTDSNIMLDIETLGTGTTAAIKSIGAVRFGTEIQECLHVFVDLQSCMDIGMTIDASTIEWWMRQSDSARSLFAQRAVPIQCALAMFAAFARGEDKVWGNGSDFDNVILSSAYRLSGKSAPWKYHNNRCFRTLKSLCWSIEYEKTGIVHSALDDATSQALHVIKCLI